MIFCKLLATRQGSRNISRAMDDHQLVNFSHSTIPCRQLHTLLTTAVFIKCHGECRVGPGSARLQVETAAFPSVEFQSAVV